MIKSASISFLSGSSAFTSSGFNSEFFSKIILLIAATVDPFLIDLLLAAFEEVIDLLLTCYSQIKMGKSHLSSFISVLLGEFEQELTLLVIQHPVVQIF